MTETEYTGAEIVRSLNRIEAAQKDFSHRLDQLASTYITRTEYEKEAERIEAEISDLKQSRAPWWAVASVIIGAGSLGLALVTLYMNGAVA